MKSVLSTAAILAFAAPFLVGCSHTEKTLPMRTALDAGNPKAAIAALNEEMDVKKDSDLPSDIKGDKALFVLDRGSIQQGVMHWDDSKRDFEAADKAIDMLDLAHNAGDSIGEYVFSSDAGKYQAPPYEKLMINTLDMLNYLEQHDVNGAKVEARRLATYQRYYKDSLKQENNPVLGLGAMLAGFAFEKGGDTDEALHYYDDALQFSGFESSGEAVARLASVSSYKSKRLDALRDKFPNAKMDDNANEGEVLFVVGYGRVPHKIPERIPIGLALTLFADDIHPNNVAAANKLAAQGLVTWINFPSLGKSQGSYSTPGVKLDGNYVTLEEAVNVEQQVRAEWKKIEGKIIISAITRLVTRLAIGQGIQAAAGKNSVVGVLGSLAAQGTLTALDTPDTRSWETLPARVAIARVRLPAGRHRVNLDVRGWHRTQEFDVQKGGWQVISLMALR